MSDGFDPDEDLTDEEIEAIWGAGVEVELIASPPASEYLMPRADTHVAGALQSAPFQQPQIPVLVHVATEPPDTGVRQTA